MIAFNDQAIELHGASLNVRNMGVLGLSMRVVTDSLNMDHWITCLESVMLLAR